MIGRYARAWIGTGASLLLGRSAASLRYAFQAELGKESKEDRLYARLFYRTGAGVGPGNNGGR